MSESDDPVTVPTTWTDVAKTITEGGVPQIIAGPAGKAISRLIAGVTDIPAAWLEKKAQSIRDETAARSSIVKSVGDASASIAASNPAVLDRALHRYLAELYRSQENREAVAEAAIEALANDPPPENLQAGPADDWMNVFERHAQNATSDEMRNIFGRILAGEIRKPGAFSLRTLQFVSLLDKTSATLIEKVIPLFVRDGFVSNKLLETKCIRVERLFLEEIGFVLDVGFGSMYQVKIGHDNSAYIHGTNALYRMKFDGTAEKTTSLSDCMMLSKTGREVADTLRLPESVEQIASSMWCFRPSPTQVEYALIISKNGTRVSHGLWVNVPRPTGGESD